MMEPEGNGRGGAGKEEQPPPPGEGLPSVPGGWSMIYAAPNRLTAIRIQGLLEALGFQVLVLEEALDFTSPLAPLGLSPEPPFVAGQDPSDSHLVVPAGETEAAKEALEVVLREIERFEGNP